MNSPLALLLVALGRSGVELARHPADAARLRHRPADLPAEVVEALRIHRAALLGLLTVGPSDLSADAADVFAERLGIADDLGMPTSAGSPGWLIAAGEAMAT